jgi:hypothetical protein
MGLVLELKFQVTEIRKTPQNVKENISNLENDLCVRRDLNPRCKLGRLES